MLYKNTGLFRFSHFCAPQINAAVSCDLTRRGGEALYIGNRVRYNQSNIGVGAQTCRLPSISALGHRQVGIWRSGADVSAPQQIVVGEPTGRLSGVREQTCRLPSKLSLGSRQVGSPTTIAVGGPTCRLPRHFLFRQTFVSDNRTSKKSKCKLFTCFSSYVESPCIYN